MADTLPTSNYYKNLGGVNLKSSKYEMSTAQFLNLRNMDFDVPDSLQKRPGSTQAISAGTSGPISSIFEFSKLSGASYVIAGSDTAMFYIAGGGLTLLSSGWSNNQPTDMLTFVDKLWMANGQKFESWNGSSLYPAGLPCPLESPLMAGATAPTLGASFFTVFGNTMLTLNTTAPAWIARGVYAAYSYVRGDSYMGPLDFVHYARNIVRTDVALNTDINGDSKYTTIYGFTIPSGYGISAVALWIAGDTVAQTFLPATIPGVTSNIRFGNLGFEDNLPNGAFRYMSLTLSPIADTSRFHLIGIIPAASLFLAATSAGVTMWASTFTPLGPTFITPYGSLDQFASVATTDAFSGIPFCWYNTNTPKYIEINQNQMFMSGFSSAPSDVWYSEIGEPENISPESKFEVRTNDGDRVYATKSYQDNMIIMKEHSFHKIIGDSADNYQLVAISNDYGCISNKTVIEYKQKLLWLDRKGILEYSGANYSIISDAIEPIFRSMNLTAAKEHACAVHHIYRNQIWFGIPINGATQNNITVVYDYLIGGWTFFDGWNPSSFGFVQASQTKPTAWRGDYSGLVHYFSESLYGDNGAGMTCLGFTRFENEGGENQTTLWRRFFLDVVPATGLTGQIQGQVFANYDISTIQATFAMYQSQFQSRAEMGIVGKAVAAQFSHYSASLPLLINGYSWANRGLRNV